MTVEVHEESGRAEGQEEERASVWEKTQVNLEGHSNVTGERTFSPHQYISLRLGGGSAQILKLANNYYLLIVFQWTLRRRTMRQRLHHGMRRRRKKSPAAPASRFAGFSRGWSTFLFRPSREWFVACCCCCCLLLLLLLLVCHEFHVTEPPFQWWLLKSEASYFPNFQCATIPSFWKKNFYV